MSPSSTVTVHGGQHDTKYVTFELLLVLHAAFVADEFWELNTLCLNQLASLLNPFSPFSFEHNRNTTPRGEATPGGVQGQGPGVGLTVRVWISIGWG